MVQEDKRYLQDKLCHERNKELLLKDLSSRLPYGVKVKFYDHWVDEYEIIPLTIKLLADVVYIGDIQPYLFPMSSMTDEQKIRSIAIQDMGPAYYHLLIDRYNEWHLDYRGLIPKGLAIDATGLNIY